MKKIIPNLFLVLATLPLVAEESKGVLSGILSRVIRGPELMREQARGCVRGRVQNFMRDLEAYEIVQHKNHYKNHYKNHFKQLYDKTSNGACKSEYHDHISAALAQEIVSKRITIDSFLKEVVGNKIYNSDNYTETYDRYWRGCDHCDFSALLKYASKKTTRKVLDFAVYSGDAEIVKKALEQDSTINAQSITKSAISLEKFWRSRTQENNGSYEGDQNASEKSRKVLEVLEEFNKYRENK